MSVSPAAPPGFTELYRVTANCGLAHDYSVLVYSQCSQSATKFLAGEKPFVESLLSTVILVNIVEH